MTVLSTPNRRVLIVGVILAILFVVVVIATYQVFTKPYPGHNDFLTVWEASRSYFYDHDDPYGPETSLRIQEAIYGRAAEPGEFPNYYAYPFYTVFVPWPVIHVSYAWATAIWMVFLEACLIGTLVLALNLFQWRPKPGTMVALILFVLACYPGARGLFLGQISHFIVLLQMLALWGLMRGHDRMAGAALALSTAKPQMVIVFVPLLLLWALLEKRWPFIRSFAAVFAGLVAVSFILQPDWIAGMWEQVRLYPDYIEVSTPAWVLAQDMLGMGDAAEMALNVLTYGFMLWTWVLLVNDRREERFLRTAMVTLTVTHLVGLRTASPHFVIFVIPLVFYLKRLAARGGWYVAGTLLALFVLPWAHFMLTLNDAKFEHPTLFLPLPLLTLAVLWFTRDMWLAKNGAATVARNQPEAASGASMEAAR